MSAVSSVLVFGAWMSAQPGEAPPAVAPASPPLASPAAARPRAARRARMRDAAVFDVVGGGSRRGAWAVQAHGGFPWLGVRAQAGVGPRGLTVGADLETALLRRFRPALLLALRWVDRPRIRLSGETLVGWLIQTGEPGRRGPNLELRVRFAAIFGRAAPYLSISTSHTLLTDRTTVITAAGEDRHLSFRHEWVPRATLGVAVAITRKVGLDAGVDLAWYDAPSRTPSLPGIHLGLTFGGGPR